MKHPCNLVRDIIPLYVDEVASTESGEVVKEHVEVCDACKHYLETMENESQAKNASIQPDVELDNVKKFQNLMQKITKKILQVVGVIESIYFLIILIGMSYFVVRIKFPAVADPAGAVVLIGGAIIIPFLLSISTFFVKRNGYKIVVRILLIPFLVISIFSAVFTMIGGVFCSKTEDAKKYGMYDNAVEERISPYKKMLPEQRDTISVDSFEYLYTSSFDDKCIMNVTFSFSNANELHEQLENINIDINENNQIHFRECQITIDEKNLTMKYEFDMRW